MKICIISDDFSPPYDEGFKKIAYHLSREFAKKYNALALGKRGQKTPFPFELIRSNPLFISLRMRRRLRAFDPELIIYIPFSSCTRNSFFRCRILKSFCPNTKIAMVAVQSCSWQTWEHALIKICRPDIVLTPLTDVLERLNSFGINSDFLPFGVDLNKFCPINNDLRRIELRKKYGISVEGRLFLHTGQITEKRNVRLLSQLQGDERQVIVIGSSSSNLLGFPHDSDLISELRKKGVIVWVEHFPNIEEIYQMADCYIYPVFNETGGIGFPLSVVEALACGIPVVTSRYGGLDVTFNESAAIRFANNNDEIISLAMDVSPKQSNYARMLVKGLGWDSIADRLINLMVK